MRDMDKSFLSMLPAFLGAIALSYPPRVRVRATVKLSAAFFNDESSVTIGGVRKCNSALFCIHTTENAGISR